MVSSARIDVVATPTLLGGRELSGPPSDVGGAGSYAVRNNSATAIDLGGSTVATGDGFELDAGTVASFDLGPGDALYAVGPAAGPYEVQVLRIGG